MANNKNISFAFTFFFLFLSCSLRATIFNIEGKSLTKITFNLKSGSQLFISFPLNVVQTKEVILYEVKKDSTIILDVYSETAFTLLNLNKQNTQFIFFPNFNYSVEIKKNQISLDFVCTDKLKQFECNVLSKMEKSVGKLNLSEEDGDKIFNKLVKDKRYTKELDSFYAIRKNSRINELLKLELENKISSNGLKILLKYIEYSFIRNRFMPFYYGNFANNYFPNWYKDTMLQYVKSFDDTTLINTKSFKGALRCMNLFLSTIKKGNNTLEAQFSIAKKFSDVDAINELMLFSVFDAPMNKKDKNYSNYIDSFKLYSKNVDFKSIIFQNYNYSKIKGQNINNLLINNNNETISFDSLISNTKKIIIIDFWATWCAPCIKELSTINNLITELGDKNIFYLFISMDEDYVKWKNSITYYPFMNDKNSYILKNGFESNLAKSNFIKSIPFYSVYKNDGTIIKNNIQTIQTPEFKFLLNQILLKLNPFQ